MTLLRVRPDAERDVDQAADYYAREANVDVALRFVAAVEETYLRLCQHPFSGTPVQTSSPRLADLRLAAVPGFDSYLVFHLASPDCIDVVRVLHAARDLPHILQEALDDDP